MALRKTQLLDIVSVTGISTVGILTVGVTQTAGGVGIASTTYIKNIIMHNTVLVLPGFRSTLTPIPHQFLQVME